MNMGDHIDYVQSRTQDNGAVVSRAEILGWLVEGLRRLYAESDYNRVVDIATIPPRYSHAITYEWEREFVKGSARKFTMSHASGERECLYHWEVDPNAVSPAESLPAITHLWELEFEHPTHQHYRVALPKGAQEVKAVWFDHKRIYPMGVAQIDDLSDSWWQVSGEPVVFVTGLSRSTEFDIYEIQTTSAEVYQLEAHDSGMARSLTGSRTYEVASETSGALSAAGTIRGVDSGNRQYFATGTPTGIIREWKSSVGNLLIIYTELPDAENIAEDTELPIPQPLQKYMRYFALYTIFNHPGELYEPNMAEHYNQRFGRGVRLFRRMGRVLNQDESYRRDANFRGSRRRGLPRLPSNYPRPR